MNYWAVIKAYKRIDAGVVETQIVNMQYPIYTKLLDMIGMEYKRLEKDGYTVKIVVIAEESIAKTDSLFTEGFCV
jgi:hypothetical protein